MASKVKSAEEFLYDLISIYEFPGDLKPFLASSAGKLTLSTKKRNALSPKNYELLINASASLRREGRVRDHSRLASFIAN